jgi:predicted O-methyltransferase YrrM
LELERELGFERSSIPEVGRFLHVLAGQRGRARVGEIGTGTGVGAAWIVSALPPPVPFVTVELDASRAAAASRLFTEDENAKVLHGDWHELMPPEAPFDLLFYDGGGKQRPELDGDEVIDLLAPGGTVVLDDLTPGLPGPDPVRDFWLEHPRLAAIELLTTPTTALILAVRL